MKDLDDHEDMKALKYRLALCEFMVLISTWLLYTFYIKVFEIYLAATPFGFAPFFSLNIAGMGAE